MAAIPYPNTGTVFIVPPKVVVVTRTINNEKSVNLSDIIKVEKSNQTGGK